MKNLIATLFISVTLASCQSSSKQEDNTMENNINKGKSLADSLSDKKAQFEQTADAQKKKIYAEGIAAVASSGVLENAKQLKDKAPDFSLTNALGEKVSLQAYLKKGPVVLTWYRGGWCPYCNITLHYLQQSLPEIQALGANLLALTPELPDESIATKEKHELKFEVLSDVGNVVAKEYGIVFKLTPEVADAYHKAFDLNKVNGDNSDELPLAATYIIAQDGTIQYAFLDADYRNRADTKTIIEALKKLK